MSWSVLTAVLLGKNMWNVTADISSYVIRVSLYIIDSPTLELFFYLAPDMCVCQMSRVFCHMAGIV